MTVVLYFTLYCSLVLCTAPLEPQILLVARFPNELTLTLQYVHWVVYNYQVMKM